MDSWFDARHSLVFPVEDPAWTLVADDTPLALPLAVRFADGLSSLEQHTTRDGTRVYVAHRLAPGTASCPADTTASPVWWSPATAFPADGFERHPLAWPVDFGPIVLTGYVLDAPELAPSSELALLTCWRVASPEHRDLKIFAHLLDASGQLAAGQDRLDVPMAGWHAGDLFVQVHRLALSADVSPGTYQLEVGWYDGETLARLPVRDGGKNIADRLLLQPVTLE